MRKNTKSTETGSEIQRTGAEMMFTRDLKTRSPFKDLFPIRENILNEIVNDMMKNGFDHAHPIVLWEGHKFTILDGHTRLEAAKQANITEVPVEEKYFPSEAEALAYAIRCQSNRRNLTDKEILQCIAELDKRKTKTEAGATKWKKLTPYAACSGKTSKITAKTLGISSRKVERARTVLDKASDEVKEAIKSGKMSINKAYNKTLKHSESLDNSKDGKQKIKKIFTIIKKRLSHEQIQELIKLLQEENKQPEKGN